MIRSWLAKLKKKQNAPPAIVLTFHELTHMIRMVAATRADEIDCDACLDQLDRFAELYLADKAAAEALPLVQDHLDRCEDCRAEFELLLAALHANTQSL